MSKFDVIGDIHGCYDELIALLAKLGYTQDGLTWRHPHSRKLLFVGDIIDRGPKVWECLETVMNICQSGEGHCVIGNHDENLREFLRNGSVVYEERSFLPTTIKQMDERSGDRFETLKKHVAQWLFSLPEFLYFDNIVLCHGKAKDLKPDWEKLDGKDITIFHGHRTVKEVCIRSLSKGGQVINVDTGVPFGGKLSAFRWTEMKVVSVEAKKQYWDTPLLEVVKYYDRKPY